MEYHPTSCDEVSGSSCLSRGTLCAFSNPVTTACTSGLSPTSTGSNPTEKPTFSDTKGTAREQAACVCLSVRKACSTGQHRLCSATVVWKEAHGRRARRVMSWQSLGTLARTSQAKTIVHWDRWERITGVHRLWLDELLLFVNLRHTSHRAGGTHGERWALDVVVMEGAASRSGASPSRATARNHWAIGLPWPSCCTTCIDRAGTAGSLSSFWVGMGNAHARSRCG